MIREWAEVPCQCGLAEAAGDLTHNLLQMLKKVSLPAEYARARPRRLRFSVFTVMGRLVSHAGRVPLRIADDILEKLIAPAGARIKALDLSPG